MEFEKLKVAELRTELANRGLDTKGTKAVLVARLKDFLDQEEGGQNESIASNAAEASMEVEDTKETEPEAEPEPEPEPQSEPQPEPAKVTPAAAPEAAISEAKESEATNGDEAMNEEASGEAKPAEEAAEAERKGVKRKRPEEEPFVVVEDEPEIDESLVCLDWYNSDLSLKIEKDNLMVAEPLFRDGWGYVWSGGRATHGVTSGKVYFEAKVLANLEVKLGDDEKNVNELRVGWSTAEANFQLGESVNSFAYGGTGKKATDCKFEDFGETFGKDDVIGAFVDFSGDTVTISFTKNGESQGAAFQVAKSELAGQALFPTVCARNVKVEVNFGKAKDGSDRESWFAPIDGYTFVANAANLVRGPARIGKREECEMYMLIGLPGSGKTTWVNNFVAEHPDKKFNIIGTSVLMERMKINGESRKQHMANNWQMLIQKSTRCLQEWLRMASQRRRNYIIDQTNVYANAQRRKIRPFQGMIRKAVVIVPSDEDYKARIEAQEKAEAKEVPDSAVMEMKANFAIPAEETPEEGETPLYSEIIFAELDREEATKVVDEYIKDAKEKGFGKRQENQQRKRARGNMRMMRGRGGFAMRGGPGMRGMPFGRFQRGLPFRGMMPPRGFMRGGPMRGGPMRGGPFPPGGPGGRNFPGMGFPRGGPGGMGPRGGRGGNFGGNMPPRGGGPMGGNKFGGPGPWGSSPSPWQQQPAALQRPTGWGSPWSQPPQQQQQQQGSAWSQNTRPQQGNQGGFGGWSTGYNQQGGYPGNQNWGGYNR